MHLGLSTTLSREIGTLLYALGTGAGRWRFTYLIKWRLVGKLILNITLSSPGGGLSLAGGVKDGYVARKVLESGRRLMGDVLLCSASTYTLVTIFMAIHSLAT